MNRKEYRKQQVLKENSWMFDQGVNPKQKLFATQRVAKVEKGDHKPDGVYLASKAYLKGYKNE